jgi:phosphoribosylanthranilate isomerase
LTKIKICGITNLDDAWAAMEAGADYLGFIFYPPSKRAITAKEAAEIISQLRDRPECPTLVGVFVNETAETIAQTLDRCRLDLAQLSGEEPPALIGDPHSPVFGRSFKALRPTSLAEAEADAEWFVPPNPAPDQPTLLLDTYHPTLRGGTGQTADWTIAAQLAQSVPGLMLAGGLNPDNVAETVRIVRPFAVDVASGVEAAPGRKNHEIVRAFITNVRLAGEMFNQERP